MTGLRNLEIFVAVAEELHFGRAAERLHMSQPPVSVAVKRLEAELGVALVERTTRHVRLTPAGEVYLDHARQVLNLLRDGPARVHEAALGVRGTLRVGLTGAIAVRLLSEWARHFRAAHPEVRVELVPFPYSWDQEDELSARRIDLGFVMHHIVGRELSTLEIAAEPMVAIVPSRHRLASRAVVGLEELAGEDFVTFPATQGSEVRNALFAACQDAGFLPRIIRETSPPHMILACVSAEEGVTLLPESTADVRVDGVTRVPVRGLERAARSFLAWRSDYSSAVAARAIEHATAFFAAQRR